MNIEQKHSADIGEAILIMAARSRDAKRQQDAARASDPMTMANIARIYPMPSMPKQEPTRAPTPTPEPKPDSVSVSPKWWGFAGVAAVIVTTWLWYLAEAYQFGIILHLVIAAVFIAGLATTVAGFAWGDE